jgi:predicted MFS family arabinose efflux permease
MIDRAFGRRGLAVLVVLVLINTLNAVDRQLPMILVDAMRRDLKLDDAQIGLMAGVSFAVIYAFATVGLARVSDRFSPRWVLSLTLAFWCLMTAASGLAQNFGQLLMARIGVAGGEAGTVPAAHALISRTYPAHRRALVVAIFSMGVSIGGASGLMLGGWINDVADWRTAFFVVGLPGLIVAALAWFILPEPRSHKETGVAETRFADGVRQLLALRSFRHMMAATTLYGIGQYGLQIFAPAFLMRTYQLSSSRAGLGIGVASGIGGMIGVFAGGFLADLLGRRDPRWRQFIPAIGLALSVPCALGAWLAPDPVASLVLIGLVYGLGLTYFAATFSTAQMLVSDDIRALASGVMLFFLTLIGASVGPYAIGRVSDLLAPEFGRFSLRYALCLVAITMAWSSLHFLLAAFALPKDLARRGALAKPPPVEIPEPA